MGCEFGLWDCLCFVDEFGSTWTRRSQKKNREERYLAFQRFFKEHNLKSPNRFNGALWVQEPENDLLPFLRLILDYPYVMQRNAFTIVFRNVNCILEVGHHLMLYLIVDDEVLKEKIHTYLSERECIFSRAKLDETLSHKEA